MHSTPKDDLNDVAIEEDLHVHAPTTDGNLAQEGDEILEWVFGDRISSEEEFEDIV